MHRMSTDWQIGPALLAEGKMLFAVGDIHGFFDLLSELRRFIQDEIDNRPDLRCKIVYLGDYIDRGPQSLEVLEFVTKEWEFGVIETVFLCGNHEQFLKSLLDMDADDEPADMAESTAMWLFNGGDSAIRSFRLGLSQTDMENLPVLRDRIVEVLGPEVVDFLKQLRLWHREDDYLFVHAGIDPVTPFPESNLEDLLWIRNPFLDALPRWINPFAVVHGHTPSCQEVLPHRIGVDTGVYMCEALTAVQIYGHQVRFLTVARDVPELWQQDLRRGQPLQYRLMSADAPKS